MTLYTLLGGLPQHQGVATSGTGTSAGRAMLTCRPTASANAPTYSLWGPASTSHLGQLGSGGLLGFAWANGNIIRIGGSYEVA
ncbi:hypothetical protein [Streptomyces europaeiscabiei]|uniref:hypothetical protein n=1 Tax=Streptomyces europaeiscabiei TaxID=146819 RepID=UPI002E2ACA07|nr:hypothetical protein [Streptomyces europaeiscabiei]